MKEYNFRNCPCRIYGIPNFDRTSVFRRLNDNLLKLFPHLEEADKRPTGARIRFRTDSEHFSIRVKLDRVYPDRGMSYYQANVGNVFLGKGSSSKYIGIVSAPDSYNDNFIYAEFTKKKDTNDVTVFLPRNPRVIDIFIGVDDEAQILSPTPYTYETPVVFYGSSITENGHTSSSNAYTALLSRWLDSDFLNFGFSGMAKGEPEIAEYISGFRMSAFVFDYDHNAPDWIHLNNTHENFFLRFREKQPDTPVIMLTRPNDDCEDAFKRRSVIYTTYKNAVNRGDKKVYYIDGRSYFSDIDREACTTDLTHPNDLGHYCMALKIYEILKDII